MRTSFILLSLGAALLPNLAAGATAVTVSFVDSPHYRDAAAHRGDYQADDAVLQGIEQHLRGLGERYLPAGQRLSVEILDIDLAGRLEPWRAQNYGVRYLRDVTWPRIKLRYVLEQEGAEAVRAEESIVDLNYLAHASLYFSSDRLRYEKQMLDDWFRARFVEHRAPR